MVSIAIIPIAAVIIAVISLDNEFKYATNLMVSIAIKLIHITAVIIIAIGSSDLFNGIKTYCNENNRCNRFGVKISVTDFPLC